ncbi:MAG: histidine kinase dimerization/phospho-acceptor domain-containing protein, partial [Pseudomonadota bacterium]
MRAIGLDRPKARGMLSAYADTLGSAVARHQAAVALNAARAEAELANRSKSEFLSNMSHELRTPLNAIIGFSQMIGLTKEHPLSDEQLIEYAGYIEQSANGLLDLITSILEISSLESGKAALTFEIVDVAAVVENCMSLIAPRAEAAGLRY